MELTARSFYEDLDREAYYRITLTDEQDIPDAAAKLRTVYPGLLRLDYDNARTRADNRIEMMENTSARKPIELFSALYEQQNGQPMTEEQRNYVSSLIELIWGDEA